MFSKQLKYNAGIVCHSTDHWNFIPLGKTIKKNTFFARYERNSDGGNYLFFPTHYS